MVSSRGLGDVYKRQRGAPGTGVTEGHGERQLVREGLVDEAEMLALGPEDGIRLADVLLGERPQGDVPVGAGPGRHPLA